MHNITILTNIPTPNQLDLFEAIGAHPNIRLKVIYCAKTEPNRAWVTRFGKSYAYKVLPGLSMDGYLHVNPGILREVIQGESDVFILGGGYSMPTFQLASYTLRVFGRKWLLWSERINPTHHNMLRRLAQRMFLMPAASNATAILAVGTMAKEMFENMGLSSERIFIFPYFESIERFSLSNSDSTQVRSEMRKRLGLTSQTTYIFCGQLVHRKGVDLLLRAYAALNQHYRNTALLVLGTGPKEREYICLASSLHANNVMFLGFVDPAEIPNYFQMADVFIFPSRYDGWGLVINEAMAAGLPIISTENVGAARDLVNEGENGFIVAADDVEETRAAMEIFLRNHDNISRFGQASKKIIQNWTPEKGAQMLCEILDKIS